MTDQDLEIKKAETEYSPIWNISNKTFKKAASEILNVDKEYIQVRRTTVSEDFGLLSVFVFKTKTEQTYYHLLKDEIEYSNLPSNINNFKKSLRDRL